jgi:serine/threonine protein kinase
MSDSHPSPTPENEPRVAAATPPGQPDTAARPAARSGAVDKIPRAFGRYRIQDRLGQGGMGTVFKAHDTQLDRTVALKVPYLAPGDTGLRQRFYREARAAATLQHANICPVFDVGELHGTPYLTMAYIEGQSLAEALEAGQSFTPTQTAMLVRKVALAMQEAHAQGVIHRDLKPSNILLRPNGEPMVMDFGLASRSDDRQSAGLTRRGDVIGTYEYMSPEQVEADNAAVGPAADVFSLGVVLYELLTGRRPFTGPTTAVVAQILLRQPTPPSELRPGVPARLEEICAKAMAKKPAERYATMAEFAAALTEYLRGEKQAASPVARAAEAPSTPPPRAETRPIPTGVPLRQPDRPPSPAPRAAPPSVTRRPRSSGRRRAPARKTSYLPVILGGAAVAVACAALVVAAIIMKPRGEPAVADSANSAPAPTPAPTLPPEPAVAPAPAPPPPPAALTTAPPAERGPRPKPEPRPALAVRCKPDAVNLAVGEQREVTVHLDRQGYRGPITLRWNSPKEVRVTPAESLTVFPGEPDPVLTVRPLAEPSAADPRLEIVAAPDRESQRGRATSHLTLHVTPGPCVRIVEVGDRRGGEIGALAFTPDASLALVGGGPDRPGGAGGAANAGADRNAIRVWSLPRGESVSPLTGHGGRVTGLAVSADGLTALSVGADETVALWDLTRSRRAWQSPKQALRVLAAAMAPDARNGLVVYPGLILRVSLDRFQAVGPPIKTAQLTGSRSDDAIRVAAVSADLKALVGGGDGKLFLIDPAEKARPKPLTGHAGSVLCAAFAPDGRQAATGGAGQAGRENAVCLWDVGEPALKWKGDGHARPVVCVAFAPDGRHLASGGADGEVRVWAVEDGKPVATFAGHTGRVFALAFTPDGKAVWSGAADGTLRQWRLP